MARDTRSAYEPRLASVAAAIGEPARSRMLASLLSGQYASAGELAAVASVSAATASAHLARLLQEGLVVCEPRGRHRYFRLADEQVAQALQALALVAESQVHDHRWQHPGRRELRAARCCYGHLAGQLAVRLFDTLQQRGCLVSVADGFALSEAGHAWLAAMGMRADPPSRRRRYAYRCLDWSERRDHLAGQLADQIFHHCLTRDWLRRGDARAVVLTERGRREWLPRLSAG